MFTNWLTVGAGIVTAVPMIWNAVETVATFHWTGDWKTNVTGLGALLLGLFAKDFNVTGAGTTATKP